MRNIMRNLSNRILMRTLSRRTFKRVLSLRYLKRTLSLWSLKRTPSMSTLKSFRTFIDFCAAKNSFSIFYDYDRVGVVINFHTRILVLKGLIFSYGSLYFAIFSTRSASHKSASLELFRSTGFPCQIAVTKT